MLEAYALGTYTSEHIVLIITVCLSVTLNYLISYVLAYILLTRCSSRYDRYFLKKIFRVRKTVL